jgi:hypothetical protein
VTEPARISFTRPAWAALTVLGLLLLGLLATQIVLLEDQRTTVDRQLAVAVRQIKAVEPVTEEARPFLRESRAALPASRRLVTSATPLVRDLRRARADEQLEAAGALARTLLGADVGTATRHLRRADLPRLATTLQQVGGELLTQDRLRRTLVRTAAVLGEVQRLHTVEKATRAAETVPRIERVLLESLAVQRETLAQTRETRALVVGLRDIGLETRELTRTAAGAARSLDRKTGPSLASASGG